MADYTFTKDQVTGKWVILAPRRSKRPDVSKGTAEPVCPFCPGKEKDEPELYRVGGQPGDSNWQVRVIANKFPFAPHHEIILHTPDHEQGFNELPIDHIKQIFTVYRLRYNTHKDKGQVYIFHNRGTQAGESLPHAHSQLTVIPKDVTIDSPRLVRTSLGLKTDQFFQTQHFVIFCPASSQWPDEVWVAPKRQGTSFGEITDDEISDFALVVSRLIQIFHLRHAKEFPHNYYIYPGGNWYLRLIPRLKRPGGFELGTGIFVNTQDPAETIQFIRENFETVDVEKIQKEHLAEYHTAV
jgi:UDPglucose--hexose-1-phosphate uridylyltransferase